MKKLFFLFILIAPLALSQDFMRIRLKDGTTTIVPLEDIRRVTFSGITGIGDKNLNQFGGLVRTFALLQNFPNPFNPTTTIEYQMPKPGNVSIRVFDITGRLVRVLVNEEQGAGIHRIQWDSKNGHGQAVASGIYVYEIRSDNFVTSRKMLLLK